MPQTQEALVSASPAAQFTESTVEADGFRIRYREAGEGEALICLHGAGGLRLSPAHATLAQHYRVVAFEVPGFGASPENTRSQTMADLAATMVQAVTALNISDFHLMGNSFGGVLALWMALHEPARLRSLVLVAPAAIRPDSPLFPPGLTPAERLARLYAHPERQPPTAPPDPAVVAKQQALVQRLIGPARDAVLESRLPGLQAPVLVVFGTADRMIPSEMGRMYCQLLPNCHLILVYDAGHAVDADRPEAFSAVVRDFLQYQEGFLVNRQSSLIHP